jgi:hypothetical protein
MERQAWINSEEGNEVIEIGGRLVQNLLEAAENAQ